MRNNILKEANFAIPAPTCSVSYGQLVQVLTRIIF